MDTTENQTETQQVNRFKRNENGFVVRGWNLISRDKPYDKLPEELESIITKDAIIRARHIIYKMGFAHNTPIIDGRFILGPKKTGEYFLKNFGIKLENTQCTGSFKIRGASYQFSKLPNSDEKQLVTISAGNYGAAFAFLANELGITQNATVFVPQNVTERRKKLIEAFGVKVDGSFHQSDLVPGVQAHVNENNALFLHPFDDADVLIGHASAGLEILEEVPAVDIVLVCCGGGGFLAGICAAFRLNENFHTKVYGVEHKKASTMFDSLEKDEIVKMKYDPSITICSGLAAPFPGTTPFSVFRAFGDGIILVNEEEIEETVRLLYNRGLVVEPSGAAAVAAILSNKVPNVDGKSVVALVTGGNVSPTELGQVFGLNKSSISSQTSIPAQSSISSQSSILAQPSISSQTPSQFFQKPTAQGFRFN